ncbi:MAG TPA: DUF4198 domain-containing protein, partial [Gemmatimonadaceae bacterium]|nr:DUF4198 domain-containing protein [Gemmatimonadaceae bacterium]
LALVVLAPALADAHDMFLKATRYFVSPRSDVRVLVLNGTFSKSENAITRDRVADVSVVGPDGRVQMDTSSWGASGDTSTLTVQTGEPGTYVVGASTRTRDFTLAAKDFNLYLREDGIPDVLAARRRDGELDKPARERYAKHIKALIQVGEARTNGFETTLGYPAEIVPLENPYTLRVGSTLRVRTLVDGQPVPNQLVIAGGRTTGGGRIQVAQVRTDSSGVASIRLRNSGTWYVKFIHMARSAADTTIDYESKWATLTFGLR